MSERHVRPNDGSEGGWLVTARGDGPVQVHTTTQGEAVETARQALLDEGGGTLYVHGTDGTVREQRSVG